MERDPPGRNSTHPTPPDTFNGCLHEYAPLRSRGGVWPRTHHLAKSPSRGGTPAQVLIGVGVASAEGLARLAAVIWPNPPLAKGPANSNRVTPNTTFLNHAANERFSRPGRELILTPLFSSSEPCRHVSWIR